MVWTVRIVLVLLALLGAAPLHAVQVDEILPDPVLEARAREISHDLRCMVCQNQSIDDSEAPLARDLRLLVRERLKAGDSDSQVVDFMVARYGEFVLLKPDRGSVGNWVLGAAPVRRASGSGSRPQRGGAAEAGRDCRVAARRRLERFRAKWKPVRVKKTRQIKNLEPRFDSIETEKALGDGPVS